MPGAVIRDCLTAYTFIMDQMHNPENVPKLFGYKPELQRLSGLIERCILYGESNSVLVIGPRGGGKSLLVKTALKDVILEGRVSKDAAFQVSLNGVLQTDDNLALEEITRQLQLENVTDGLVFGSFAEKLQFLLDSLRTGGRETKPVVFVLDEFDMFTHHKNQTLLYNLLDISQSRQTPVCIIGVTCRLDVIELLEKRVKSRFSHRTIHMFNNLDYPSLKSMLLYYMQLPSDHQRKSYSNQWNDRVALLLDDPVVKDAIIFNLNITKDINSLKKLVSMVVGRCKLSTDKQYLLELRDFQEALKIVEVDPKASMLIGVSVLELCLIIAMKQLTEIYNDEPFNFQMIYEHYKKFADRKFSTKAFDKAIVMKAFEHLIDLEIVKPSDHSHSVLKEYRPMRLLVESREVDEAVLHYNGCPSDIKQWASSDLDCH